MSAQAMYDRWRVTPNDMQSHLETIYACSIGLCVELGCSQGISTSAMLAGVDDGGGMVVSVSIDDVSHLYRGHPRWAFLLGDSTNEATVNAFRQQFTQPINLLLLDSQHTYEHVTRELDLWSPLLDDGAIILVHDTEYAPGVRRAVEDWTRQRIWPTTFILPDNGMAMIEVPV